MNDSDDAFLYHIVGWPFVNLKAANVGVAVSGGSDSMALLLLMQHWAQENGAHLRAVTVNHGLRSGAAEEAAGVAAFCADLKIPHDILRWQGWDGSGNLQAAAREARYGLIAEWAKGRGVEAVCLGHTRDDQAETFLMRLARKAGSDGLRGMPQHFERHGIHWVRPVLGQEREALRVFLQRQGVAWVDDPSNEDESFDRVKARKALDCLAPLGIDAETLAQVTHNLAMENGIVRHAVIEAYRGKVSETCGALSLGTKDFLLQHPEIGRRFLIATIQWLAGSGYAPRWLALTEMAFELRQGKTHTLGGVIGWSAKGRIWLARELQAVKDARGNPFDNRWHIDGPLDGLEIRALGEDGLKQWPGWRGIGVPRRVLLPLPGVWKDDELVAIPHDPAEKRYKASLITTSFQNWLSQH